MKKVFKKILKEANALPIEANYFGAVDRIKAICEKELNKCWWCAGCGYVNTSVFTDKRRPCPVCSTELQNGEVSDTTGDDSSNADG
jgi:rubrerythrin